MTIRLTEPRLLETAIIDLSREYLEMWQPEVLRLKVEAMKKGIELGMRFPAVDVVRTPGGVYQLVSGEPIVTSESQDNYGGHHRTMAHYQTQTPMRVNVFSHHRERQGYVHQALDNLALTEPKGSLDYGTIEDSVNHLPMGEQFAFCKEHRLFNQVSIRNPNFR